MDMLENIGPLFALPLVGGYFLNLSAERLRYRQAHEAGHRLYFRAAESGLWLFIAFLVALLAGYLILDPLVKCAGYDVSSVATKRNLLISSLVLAGCAGRPVAWVLNRMTSGEKEYVRAVHESEFDLLLLNAVSRNSMVQVTLDDHSGAQKVYIGHLARVPDPSRSQQHIGMVPMASGYRDPSNCELCITTFYDEVYESQALGHLGVSDYTIVISLDKICSIRQFDWDAYSEFQRDTGQGQAPN